MMSSKDVIDYPPQSATTCPKYATALPSILNPFKNAFTHTELKIRRRLTISKWRHCIFYVCANPHVTGDCICAYIQLVPEAVEQQDSDGMTPLQRLCRNAVTFFEDRSFSSVMTWWYGCMPPLPHTETGKKRKWGWSIACLDLLIQRHIWHYDWRIGDCKAILD